MRKRISIIWWLPALAICACLLLWPRMAGAGSAAFETKPPADEHLTSLYFEYRVGAPDGNYPVEIVRQGKKYLLKCGTNAAVSLDKKTVKQIEQLLWDCKVRTWDGFKRDKSNGNCGCTSFKLRTEFSDGSSILASGIKSYPETWNDFNNGLLNICIDALECIAEQTL